ncbi:MAG: 4Fe-4S dicluster domain-containing protein [Deltaproteobacteria bacterium]|nr:4Fe-4S dicluster domain-containing protein [Deltaproteobacteria bacterium]
MLRLKGRVEEQSLLEQVLERSGQNLLRCLQCGKCSGSCPISSAAVGGPRRLIARILGGMQEEALRDPTWWYCVSCGTCAGRCPVEINMYAVSTALCEIAAARGIEASEPGIHLFEDLFLKSVKKNGRVRELRTVLEYNLRSLRPFTDALIGARLALKGNISPAAVLRPGRRDRQVTRIFEKIRQKQGQKA